MKALTKKLLSWLCVMAMVLSMVPAVALVVSAEGTETSGQTDEIVYGSANLPDGTQDIIDAAKVIQDADLAAHVEAGTCPICGTVEGGWKEANGPDKTEVEGQSRHYYVKDTTQVNAKYNWYAGNANNMTMCLALLNTTEAKEIGGLIGMRNRSSGSTLNIMGSGTITSDGTKTGDGQFGVICVQGSQNTVNIYGGTFIYTGDGQGRTEVITDNGDGTTTTTYTPSGAVSAGAITVKGGANGNTVNIFDGVVIGPETQDTTKPCYNVVMMPQAPNVVNTINMYGGTIRNGVSTIKNTAGNVHMHYDKSNKLTKPTFNMYGGLITGGVSAGSGGNVYAGQGAQFSMYGGTVTGGKVPETSYGGNFFFQESSVSRATFAGGTVEKGEARYGGNIYSIINMTITGTAAIRDGEAALYGGNIYFSHKDRTATISGGLITGGVVGTSSGGNIYAKIKEVNISGGVIEKGQAVFGGNIANYSSALNISGGTIQNGVATGSSGGGNIYATANSDFDGDEIVTITGGTIQGGKSTSAEGGGGNLRVNCAAVNIGGNALIRDGESGFMGGNLYSTSGCVVTIDGNAVFSGGRSNSDGGSIALYNGKLTIGGNAQIKDGKATRYTVTRDEEGEITKENYVADGGNIYCHPYYTKVDEVKVYSNELAIKDNAVISGGWAVRGGNIAADSTLVNIESGVVIKDGCAGLEVDGEMTYSAEKDTVGRGGNIYHGTKECEVNIAATISGGTARFGANLFINSGTVNFSGIMEDGYAYSFGGNATVHGTSTVLNLNNAQLRNSASSGQGGSLRIYQATVNMNGGAIYGGNDQSKNNTDNLWLVCGTLNMTGNATVTGTTESGSAARLVSYNGLPSVVTLADTASVVGAEGAVNAVSIQKNADGVYSSLYIQEGWAGTAYIGTTDSYTYGDTINDGYVKVGSFAEDGTFVKGGTYTGQLYRNVISGYGVEGDVVLAAAGYIAEDGTTTTFRTNNEALAAYEHSENAYVILSGETADIPETVSELNVEIQGNDITFTGSAKLYVSDKENDDYVGGGKVMAAEGAEITVEPVVIRNEKRYVALQNEEGAWTFHRLRIFLDTVTLRTEGNPGIYYKAAYYCDEVLRDLVDSYGVALSVADMPGADFETADKYTAYTGEDFAAAYADNKVSTVSGAVTGIMKERNSKERNTANAQVEIYANVYLKLNLGEESLLIMADEANAGKTADAEDFTGVAYSLFEVLGGINGNWDSYSQEEQATMQNFLVQWSAYITDEAVAALMTSLDKIFPAA